MAVNFTGIAALLNNVKLPEGVLANPPIVDIPSPPRLEGTLRSNNFLTRVQAIAFKRIQGPESMVIVNRYIYTGLRNGWVVEINPFGKVRQILRMSIPSCGRENAGEDACGRPLGLRADRNGYLVVADAYNGIFRIHPVTGAFRQLVDARNDKVNGKPLTYINDLAVAKDGTIFFTSSSTRWKPSQNLNIFFEGETSGRVLVYNPKELLKSRRVRELVTTLHYPNGLQLSADENYLLIGEGGRSKIYKAWIGRKSPKFGTIETLAENLPGFVDNIRLSPRGTYWVALSRARHANLPSVLDTYGKKPEERKKLIALVNANMIFDDPKFGIVVELNDKGEILRSLQDPDGKIYTSISEVDEEKGFLYIASKSKEFVGVINLNTLPELPPEDPFGGPMDLDAITDQNLKTLLNGVQNRLQQLNEAQVRSMVLLLVSRLYQAKLEARRAMEEVTKLRQDLNQLQEMIGTSGGGGGNVTEPSVSTPSTPSIPEASADNESTTAAFVVDDTTTTTTQAPGGGVVAPDMGGSSGIGDSIDGGTQGQPATSSPQTGSTEGSTTPLAGDTTTSSGGDTTSSAGDSATTSSAGDVTTSSAGETTTKA